MALEQFLSSSTRGASVTIAYQLWRPEAQGWFDIRVADAEW
ncbi:hypothetical protein ACW2Q0_06750 [Nocardia sp. R16R-3T]